MWKKHANKPQTWSEILESPYTFVSLSMGGLAYVCSMFVAPIFQGDFSWGYVQAVWDRWQGLNVGVLAFAASLTAFSISRGKERRR